VLERALHHHGDKLADRGHAFGHFDVHDLVFDRPTLERAVFPFAHAVHEHFLRRAYEAVEVRPAHFFGELEKARKTGRLFGLGHVVSQLEGRSAGARGVLEREEGREARFANERERGLEVLLGFAGEAHDDVGGERERFAGGGLARHRQSTRALEVFFTRVAPNHAPQEAVRSGLNRHVHVPREDVEIAVRRHERSRGVTWVWARVTKPQEVRNLARNLAQQ
jgi:hypothetical protein